VVASETEHLCNAAVFTALYIQSLFLFCVRFNACSFPAVGVGLVWRGVMTAVWFTYTRERACSVTESGTSPRDAAAAAAAGSCWLEAVIDDINDDATAAINSPATARLAATQ